MGGRIKGTILSMLMCLCGINLFIGEIPNTTAKIIGNVKYIFNNSLNNIAIAHIPVRKINKHGVSVKTDAEIVAIVYKDKYFSIVEQDIIDGYQGAEDKAMFGSIDTLLKTSSEAIHLILGPKNYNQQIVDGILDGNNPTKVIFSTTGGYYRDIYAPVIGISLLFSLITYIAATLTNSKIKYSDIDDEGDNKSRLKIYIERL